MRNIICVLAMLLFITMSCKEGAKEKLRTQTGFEYIHHISNDGDKPTEGSEVTYHRQLFLNDSMVQSTYKSGPVTALLPARSLVESQGKGNVPPDYDAMFLMSPGDSMSLFQTFDTVPQLPPTVSKDDILTYHVKLVSFRPAAEIQAEKAAAQAREKEVELSTSNLIKDYKAGKLNAQLKTTASGLKYIIHEEGTGVQAEAGKTVDVHYSGFLTDGKNFDNSYKRGQPISFPLGAGRVIKGWDEGIALLKAGSKATLFIPYELGYGEAGSPPNIPGKSELVFYVELDEVK